MTWSTPAAVAPTPVTYEAVYFLVLEREQVVLHSDELKSWSGPMEWGGNLDSFMGTKAEGTPFIPVDPHTALSLGWLSSIRLANNMPYLDESIRAAIALVT